MVFQSNKSQGYFQKSYMLYTKTMSTISKDLIHPGGQFILEFVRGKEISRYLNGVVNLEFL